MYQLEISDETYSTDVKDLDSILNRKTKDQIFQMKDLNFVCEEATDYDDSDDEKKEPRYNIKLKHVNNDFKFTKIGIEDYFKLLKYPAGNIKILNKENLLSDVKYLINKNSELSLTVRYDESSKNILHCYPNEIEKPVNPLLEKDISNILSYVKNMSDDIEFYSIMANQDIHNISFITNSQIEYVDKTFKIGYNLHFDQSFARNHIQTSTILYDKLHKFICFVKDSAAGSYLKTDMPKDILIEPLINQLKDVSEELELESELKLLEGKIDKLYDLNITSQKVGYLFRNCKNVSGKLKLTIFKDYLIKNGSELIEEPKTTEDLKNSKLSIYKLFVNSGTNVFSLTEESKDNGFKIKEPIGMAYFAGNFLEANNLIYNAV